MAVVVVVVTAVLVVVVEYSIVSVHYDTKGTAFLNGYLSAREHNHDGGGVEGK